MPKLLEGECPFHPRQEKSKTPSKKELPFYRGAWHLTFDVERGYTLDRMANTGRVEVLVPAPTWLATAPRFQSELQTYFVLALRDGIGQSPDKDAPFLFANLLSEIDRWVSLMKTPPTSFTELISKWGSKYKKDLDFHFSGVFLENQLKLLTLPNSFFAICEIFSALPDAEYAALLRQLCLFEKVVHQKMHAAARAILKKQALVTEDDPVSQAEAKKIVHQEISEAYLAKYRQMLLTFTDLLGVSLHPKEVERVLVKKIGDELTNGLAMLELSLYDEEFVDMAQFTTWRKSDYSEGVTTTLPDTTQKPDSFDRFHKLKKSTLPLTQGLMVVPESIGRCPHPYEALQIIDQLRD